MLRNTQRMRNKGNDFLAGTFALIFPMLSLHYAHLYFFVR